jgi:hypothetical protein
MTKLELTDEKEIEDFKQFCEYKEQWISEARNWKELRAFAEKMQFGSFTLTIKDGVPVRIDNPLQQIVLGIFTKLK